MKKIVLISIIALFTCIGITMVASENKTVVTEIGEFSKDKYPIKKHHDILRMDCKSCHGDGPESSYTEVSTQDCLKCHQDYEILAERTEFLGYDDNIHASPHYPDMDCNLCHASHEESKNYCVMCHSQDSMKNMLIP